MRNLLTIGCALAIAFAAGLARAEEWGDLKGQFVLSGVAPKPAPLVVPGGAGCGAVRLVDESLVIGPNGGIKNVVVYLYIAHDAKGPPVHEEYAKTAMANVTLDNEKCRFEPRIALLRTTQTLVVGNKDAVGHNTKIECIENTSVNPLIPAGVKLKLPFPKPERLPSTVSCSIHPWMSAKVLIRDNPYFAITDENGKFTIKNLPAGKWTFQFWHERMGFLAKGLSQDGKPLVWTKGRPVLAISEKGTDIGKVDVASEFFK